MVSPASLYGQYVSGPLETALVEAVQTEFDALIPVPLDGLLDPAAAPVAFLPYLAENLGALAFSQVFGPAYARQSLIDAPAVSRLAGTWDALDLFAAGVPFTYRYEYVRGPGIDALVSATGVLSGPANALALPSVWGDNRSLNRMTGFASGSTTGTMYFTRPELVVVPEGWTLYAYDAAGTLVGQATVAAGSGAVGDFPINYDAALTGTVARVLLTNRPPNEQRNYSVNLYVSPPPPHLTPAVWRNEISRIANRLLPVAVIAARIVIADQVSGTMALFGGTRGWSSQTAHGGAIIT